MCKQPRHACLRCSCLKHVCLDLLCKRAFTCSNGNFGEVVSLNSTRSSRASQIFITYLRYKSNFIRNEDPSFLLFTSQYIATDTRVSIYSYCTFILFFIFGFSRAAREALYFIKITSVRYCIRFLYITCLHIYMAVFAMKQRRPLERCATMQLKYC